MSRGTTYSPIHPIFHSKFFDRIFCSPPVSLPFLHVKLYSNESGDPSLLREISICFCEAHWRCMVQDGMKKVILHVNWMLPLRVMFSCCFAPQCLHMTFFWHSCHQVHLGDALIVQHRQIFLGFFKFLNFHVT